MKSSYETEFDYHPLVYAKKNLKDRAYLKSGLYNLMTEEFLLAIPDNLTWTVHERVMRKVNSHTMKNMHSIRKPFPINSYRMLISEETYMKLTINEDRDSQELQTISRMRTSLLNHQCSKLYMRVCIVNDYINQVLLRDWKIAV